VRGEPAGVVDLAASDHEPHEARIYSGPVPEPYAVRHARAADLRHIGAIEEAGGALFEEALGDLTGDALLSPAPSGGERLDSPGFLLVAGPVGAPVGFAHVEYVDGFAYLAQLSVLPAVMRSGIGSALVRAAMAEAWQLGFGALSLTTYRDLPWNGPFYARLGFVEVDAPEPFQRHQRQREIELGLDRHGPRVVMSVALGPKLPAGELASRP
jgi:GNAT superfamily N-acetyltransferase